MEMMTTPKIYQRVGRFTDTVEAMQYDGNNGRYVTDWTGGKAVQSPVLEPGPDNESGAYMQLTNEKGGMTLIVNVGCFIIKDKTGHFTTYSARVFADMFSDAMIESEAPPLGIVPRWLHEENRAKALGAAFGRYSAKNMQIPVEWVHEYNELMSRKK